MLIGDALANALAFTGSSYLFHRLSADNIDAERKRHDAAIEALQKAQIEWTHKCQHYQINLCQNWTIFIRTIQNAIGTRHFNIGAVRTVSDTFPQNF